MKYRMTICFSLPVFLLIGSFCYAGMLTAGIDTKVVRVLATNKSSYYHKPWKSPNFDTVAASGFFFEDNENFPGMKGLILTNAHAVAMSQSIKVSNGREKRRYKVRQLGICNTADFAVLQMEPQELEVYESRNGKIMPLKLGDSDKLRVGDKVLGWGYPLGGERISKSEEGEINRIEVNRYTYSQEYWLMVQASLQQNQGNSGGPVLKDGVVVGIAFQGVSASDRINYFIPINLVRSLMPLLQNQELIPHWQYEAQPMFPRLKEYYKLKPDQAGVLLNYVIPNGGPHKFGLRANDILLEIEGHEIDDFGDIFYQPLGQKIYFEEILNRKKIGDPLTFRVIRKGKVLEIQGKVTPGLPKLVPKIFTRANYFISGGIGFVELAVGQDNDEIAGDAETGGGTVEHDGAGAARSGDRVGHETVAGAEIEHLHLFAGHDVGGGEQVLVDGNGPLVTELETGERGLVDLRLEHETVHVAWRPARLSLFGGIPLMR